MLPAHRAILDGEIIAFHEAQGILLPLAAAGEATLSYGTSWGRPAVPVIFIAFDILYSNGRLVLAAPLRKEKNSWDRAAGKGKSRHLIVNSHIP